MMVYRAVHGVVIVLGFLMLSVDARAQSPVMATQKLPSGSSEPPATTPAAEWRVGSNGRPGGFFRDVQPGVPGLAPGQHLLSFAWILTFDASLSQHRRLSVLRHPGRSSWT